MTDGQGEAGRAGRGQAGEQKAQDLPPFVQTPDGGCGEEGARLCSGCPVTGVGVGSVQRSWQPQLSCALGCVCRIPGSPEQVPPYKGAAIQMIFVQRSCCCWVGIRELVRHRTMC